jgi:HAD superfamily hydrolase (TIGR01662 family)
MLYIFDLDGTLVEKFGTQPLPNVRNRLEQLASSGCKFAVASNQAGLAWRIMTNNSKFPDVQSMGNRFTQITKALSRTAHVPWFISVFDSRVNLSTHQYDKLIADLVNACPKMTLRVEADPEWRKPMPGMLIAAGEYYSFEPDDIKFVGDYKTDAEAASTAGIGFVWAADFFGSIIE